MNNAYERQMSAFRSLIETIIACNDYYDGLAEWLAENGISPNAIANDYVEGINGMTPYEYLDLLEQVGEETQWGQRSMDDLLDNAFSR